MTRDVGDDPMTAIPWPSACVFQPETPPGYSRFVANKGEIEFDRAMTARSKFF
jgi:hypothetical protein